MCCPSLARLLIVLVLYGPATELVRAQHKVAVDAIDLRRSADSFGVGHVHLSNLSEDWDENEPLPPLEEELWLHGGAHLYEPEGDKRNWPNHEAEQHFQVLRLPEDWREPRPLTAFQQFLGTDPVLSWPGQQWFGEEGFQWEPRFVGHGSYELFGIALEQGDRRNDGIGHQLLVDFDLRWTGTERAHVQFRPLGRKNSGGSFFQLSNPAGYQDNSTGIPDRWWVEGEFYSLFGGVLHDQFTPRDYHFVVGKFPIALHNSLLINDDVTGVAVNKNTILLSPFSNINVQGFYLIDDVDAIDGASSEFAGTHLTADYRHALFEATYAYLDHTRGSGRDAHYAAFSGTQFFGTLTLAARTLWKWGDDVGRGNGRLHVLESSYHRRFSHALEHSTGIEHGVFYANAFQASQGWNSISGGNFDRLRRSFEANPLVAITSGRPAVKTTGVALGVQLFRCHEDESFIPEVSFESPDGPAVWAFGMTYLRKLTARVYLDARGVVAFSDDERFDREGVFVSTFVIF